MNEQLMRIEDLVVSLAKDGATRAVDGVSLAVGTGEPVAVVGESGCGKSVTAYATLGLLASGLRAAGGMTLNGQPHDLGSARTLHTLRGSDVAMIFQDPQTSLNPLRTVGLQVGDVLRRHTRVGRRARHRQVLELLRRVGIPAPDRVARAYPFELSGGMRQRVLIAMAISCRPKLLIADEPTTALDTTVQAQIMELLRELVREEKMGLLFISHDLGLVAQFCERVYVMYAGRVVESGSVRQVLQTPAHPYTRALVDCLATMGSGADRLATLPGSVPRIQDMPRGCRFAPRCPYATDECLTNDPALRRTAVGSEAACWRLAEIPQRRESRLIGSGAP